MKIDDGLGSGQQAHVDSEGRLRTFSVSEPEDKHINREGQVWSYNQDTTAAGTNDFVFYIKNNGASELAITDLRAVVSGATILTIEPVSGVAGGTLSALSPTSRNLGASQVPDVLCYESADITGIVGSGILYFQACAAAATHYHLKMSATIIIPQGQAVGIKSTAMVGVQTMISIMGLES